VIGFTYLEVGRHVVVVAAVPERVVLAEEGAGQLHREPLLVVLRLVLGHAEQHGGCVGGWKLTHKISFTV
jgi:hypothetical protein